MKPLASSSGGEWLAAVGPLVDSLRLTIHIRHILDGTRNWVGIQDVRDVREELIEVSA